MASAEETFEVVTVTNGDVDSLSHTLASVLAQTGASFLYTVLNGGAESLATRLPQAVLRDPRVRLIERKDASLWEGMNNALEAAHGDWLLFLNAGDMFADARSLCNMIQGVAGSPSDDVHCFQWRTFVRADDGRLMRLRHRKPEPIERLVYKLPFCHQATWARTSVLRRHRFMPARAGQSQSLDHGLFLRASQAGSAFRYHPLVTTLYAAGGLSDTRRVDALMGNAWNTALVAGRPVVAAWRLLNGLLTQTAAIVPRAVRTLRPWMEVAAKNFGAMVEAAAWMGHVARSKTTAGKNQPNVLAGDIDSAAVLVQFDPFAASVAEWAVRTSVIGKQTAVVISERYGHSMAPGARHMVVERHMSLRGVIAAVSQALRLRRSADDLSPRARAQINASVIRRFPGRLAHQIPMYSVHRGRSLLTFLLMRSAAERLFNAFPIRRILINDLSYAHNYAFIQAAFRAGVRVSYYSTGFRSDEIYLRTVRGEAELIHAVTAGPNAALQRPRKQLGRARRELAEYYRRSMAPGTYAGARGGWMSAPADGAQPRIRDHFNTGKSLVVIFSHVLFDANGAYGVDLFSSMERWLRETLLWYRDFGSDDCFIVVKEHPANKFKVEAKHGSRPPCAERLIFDELGLGSLPHRFGFLSDEQAFATSTILQEAAGCVTVRGSVAVEAAVTGVPVLVAGSSRFSGWGFVNEPQSMLAYFIELNTFFKASRRRRQEMIARATRYAEGTLYHSAQSTAPWHITHEQGSKPRFVERAASMEAA